MTSSMTSKASYFKAWFLILVVVVLEWWTFFCFLGFLGQKVILTIAICVTFTRDLETEGHVLAYVTFFISACMYSTVMIFMLLREVFRSLNSFQLSPFAWLSRVTLTLKVTSRSTWLLLFLLVFVLPRWLFFCFVRFLVQGIHSNYCQLRNFHAWPWKPKVTSFSTWLFELSGC